MLYAGTVHQRIEDARVAFIRVSVMAGLLDATRRQPLMSGGAAQDVALIATRNLDQAVCRMDDLSLSLSLSISLSPSLPFWAADPKGTMSYRTEG